MQTSALWPPARRQSILGCQVTAGLPRHHLLTHRARIDSSRGSLIPHSVRVDKALRTPTIRNGYGVRQSGCDPAYLSASQACPDKLTRRRPRSGNHARHVREYRVWRCDCRDGGRSPASGAHGPEPVAHAAQCVHRFACCRAEVTLVGARWGPTRATRRVRRRWSCRTGRTRVGDEAVDQCAMPWSRDGGRERRRR